ncbi:MAG: BamA/TamA family outer membrane protein, partial [bacterium]
QLYAAGQNFVHYFGASKTEQDVDFGGLRIDFGGTKGIFKFFHVGFRSATYDPRNFVTAEDDSQITDLPPSIADDLNETQIQTFSLGLSTDLRDNRVFPLDGFWGSVIAERASDQTNSDVDFSRVTLDARFYKRVLDKNVVAFHLKGGYVTEEAPFYERFYLGGANSLRGYDFSRLTPLGGGTKLILANMEFRFPITTKNFPYHKTSGVIFFDTGGIWLPGQTPRMEDFVTSIGLGVRIRLPVVGVTRFDFAFPLKKIDENDFTAHISLGLTF